LPIKATKIEILVSCLLTFKKETSYLKQLSFIFNLVSFKYLNVKGMTYETFISYSDSERASLISPSKFDNYKVKKKKYQRTIKKKIKKNKKNKKMAVKRPYNSNGSNGKMFKTDVVDPRFDFKSKEIDWTARVSKQPLINTEVLVLDPNIKNNDKIEGTLLKQNVTFDLPPQGILLPGNKTRFYIKGIFEKKEAGSNIWSPVPNTDASKVIVCPNWFEKIIDKVELLASNGSSTLLNKTLEHMTPYLNEMLYAHMDPDLKKYLCKEPSHTGNAVTLIRSKWDYTGEDWTKYHPSIFKNGEFQFSYIPFDTWPLFQNGSFMLDYQEPPKAVDLTLFESPQIKITWQDIGDFQNIFKKKADNTSNYRLRITEIKLALELGKENFQNKEPFPKTTLEYSGTTKLSNYINVVENEAYIKFSNIKLPTSLLFFFLPKNVSGATSKYQTETENAGFRKHPLKQIEVKFNMQNLHDFKVQNLNEYLGLYDAYNLENHCNFPIAGIPVNKDTITLQHLLDDGTIYAFPHNYLRLSPGYHQRNMSYGSNNMDQFKQPGNLDIKMRFTDDNQINNELMVVVYAFYDDYNNVVVDLKKKTFKNPNLSYNITV